MPTPRTDRALVPLSRAVAYRSARRFLSVLREHASDTASVPPTELAGHAQMARVLLDLELETSLEGISRYITAWEPDRPVKAGGAAHLALDWCRRIGATRAAAYLADAAALFPGGRIPDDFNERSTMAYRIEGASPSAFEELDRRHHGALADMVERLRDYVRDHLGEVERDLARGAAAPPPATVATVLAVADDAEFMERVARLDEYHHGVPFTQRPDPLGMLGGLGALYADVVQEGMWKFLAQREGEGFHETLAWCERIGAKRAVEQLRAVAALYPRGRVPRDERKRYAVVRAIEEEVSPRHPVDRLGRIDDEHAGSMDELAKRLRTWVRGHRAEVERALAAAAARPIRPKTPVRTKMVEEGLALLQRAANEQKARGKQVAQRAGTVDLGAPAQRFAAFTEALLGLSQEQWLLVGERYEAQAVAINRARGIASGVLLDISLRRIPVKGKFDERVREPVLAARTRILAAVAALEETVATKAGAFPLRQAAKGAVIDASLAFMALDYMRAQKGGAKAAERLFEPFAGLAPMPEAASGG